MNENRLNSERIILSEVDRNFHKNIVCFKGAPAIQFCLEDCDKDESFTCSNF